MGEREGNIRARARIFGAALDFLDDRERLALKLSYLRALAAGRVPEGLPLDPYDAIAPLAARLCNGRAELVGKVEIPGWLTPRPGLSERRLVSAERYCAFMDESGPKLFVEECEHRAREIFPAVPVMIAVDHSLAAGPIRAASWRYWPERLAVVVLDQHFDAVPAHSRAESAGLGWQSEGWCGDFLGPLLHDGVVLPHRLFVAGVCDFPSGTAAGTAYGKEYLGWLDRGVRIFKRDEAAAGGFAERLAKEVGASGATALYVSLDADVAAGAGMSAVRFFDRPGIPAERVIEIASGLRRMMDEQTMALAGMDVCEVDVHLLGLAGEDGGEEDRTAEACAEFIAKVLAGGY